MLNRIGFKQVSEDLDINWGIALLKLNTELFPEDGNLWDTLGEGYFLINDTVNSLKSYKKALELKPESNCYWCDNATKRIEQLNKK